MSPSPDATTPFRIGIIPEFLARVLRCNLQQISLSSIPHHRSVRIFFDWQGVANILTQHQFDDLQQIRVIIHLSHDGYNGRRRAEAIIRESTFFITFSASSSKTRSRFAGSYYWVLSAISTRGRPASTCWDWNFSFATIGSVDRVFHRKRGHRLFSLTFARCDALHELSRAWRRLMSAEVVIINSRYLRLSCLPPRPFTQMNHSPLQDNVSLIMI